MDARLVWDTWRQILTDDQLAEDVLHPGGEKLNDLDGARFAILADYASTPQATATNIGMYRRGLVRNALAALSLVPLSRRLLYQSSLDPDAVAADFTRATSYADHGPNLWRCAAGLVAYLAARPEFAAHSWQDVLALDAATIALARQLGACAPDLWPENAATRFAARGARLDQGSARFVTNRAATVASTHHDLTPWLENPDGFNTSQELEPAARHWLIYLPTAGAAYDYAEFSERAFNIFTHLSVPRNVADIPRAFPGLSQTAALKVMTGLAELGVVVRAEDSVRPEVTPAPTHQGTQTIGQRVKPAKTPDDAFVMLDPAVDILDAEIGQHRLLCHSLLEIGVAVPSALSPCLSALNGRPIAVGALRAAFGHLGPLDKMLASLRHHGFLHVTLEGKLSAEELARLRRDVAQDRMSNVRRALAIDLDSPASWDQLHANLETSGAALEVLLHCKRLACHKQALAVLARLRQAGTVRMHRTVIQTDDLTCDAHTRQSLLCLGASVVLRDVAWPAPDHAIPGLADMVRSRVAVHALMRPDLSILSQAARDRALAWVTSGFISGLWLRLEAVALWPVQDASQDDFAALFGAVRALESAMGDVRIENMPSDEVLLGNTQPAARTDGGSAFADRFRRAYLHQRLCFLKSCEGDNIWSQTPEAEEKVVRAAEDLLPNNPDLLRLRPGSVVVDVCGGLGRVARRLAPAVGQDGLIISIEMLRCLSDRARQTACEQHFLNLDFRPGLAQRLPLPDGTADAAVNEWTGAIWELGLGPAMVGEMARVVRPGGRIAVTHRLVRMPLTRLGQPWVQYDQIYTWMRAAFARSDLKIVAERVWGQTIASLLGENATAWRKQYVPRIANPLDVTYESEDSPGPHADIYLTIIADRQ
jgi:ubiquinone/menaquinone biosynthesis C-methylase UbiE